MHSKPADSCWPWKVQEQGRQGRIFGPDGKYRGSMRLEKARALVQELNGLDPRVDHQAYAVWRRTKLTSG